MNYHGKLYGKIGMNEYFYTGKTAVDFDNLQSENERLRKVLEKIAAWELPKTGKLWDENDPTREMSYESQYGSNGAREYIKNLASEALAQTPGQVGGTTNK